MLETAHALVREQGTDALTLGALAERAGVSKPIAYGHFETRAGLLIALHQQINAKQITSIAEALDRAPPALDAVSRLLAGAMMDCYVDVGPELHAIAAALRGDARMEAYQREVADECLALYAGTLAPLSSLPAEVVYRRCAGIVGAAETLSEGLARGTIAYGDAVDDLAALIALWLSPAKG